LKAGTNKGLRALEANWLTEYRYRKLFHVARHEDYMDEPGEAIQWMVRIDDLMRREEERRRES
jgi:hypothetical protein